MSLQCSSVCPSICWSVEPLSPNMITQCNFEQLSFMGFFFFYIFFYLNFFYPPPQHFFPLALVLIFLDVLGHFEWISFFKKLFHPRNLCQHICQIMHLFSLLVLYPVVGAAKARHNAAKHSIFSCGEQMDQTTLDSVLRPISSFPPVKM